MNKLRLIVTKNCNRNCLGCCNHDWELDNNKYYFDGKDYSKYDEIYLTGGEPLLYSESLLQLIKYIKQFNKPIFVYTAYTKNINSIIDIIKNTDGITFTIHKNKDKYFFYKLSRYIVSYGLTDKSLRVNIFNNINIENIPPFWKVKNNIKWIKDCPLPENEVLKVLYPPIDKYIYSEEEYGLNRYDYYPYNRFN